MLKELVTLSNGVTIPKIALGVWQIEEEKVTSAVETAIKIGYKHVDTALVYENEFGVGKAIRNSGIRRSEIFITSKIPAEIKDYEGAKKALETSLSNLDIEYIDLMLIHAPRPWSEMFIDDYKSYYEENIVVWQVLEEAYKSGIVKAIGVSNFSIDDIENIISNCEIVPMVNQVELYIGKPKSELLAYCKEKNIIVEAYSPLANGKLLNNEDIARVAEKYGKTIAQICIRYVLQKNTIALPKSVHEKYMIQNADVNFVISEDDMLVLDNIKM